LTRPVLLSTRETVETDTPARCATSSSFAAATPPVRGFPLMRKRLLDSSSRWVPS
jgi:hypothetical protein